MLHICVSSAMSRIKRDQCAIFLRFADIFARNPTPPLPYTPLHEVVIEADKHDPDPDTGAQDAGRLPTQLLVGCQVGEWGPSCRHASAVIHAVAAVALTHCTREVQQQKHIAHCNTAAAACW